jgi:hypothetical protein
VQTNETLPARLEKAGITVKVEQASSGKVAQFFVVFCRGGKQQKETVSGGENGIQRRRIGMDRVFWLAAWKRPVSFSTGRRSL